MQWDVKSTLHWTSMWYAIIIDFSTAHNQQLTWLAIRVAPMCRKFQNNGYHCYCEQSWVCNYLSQTYVRQNPHSQDTAHLLQLSPHNGTKVEVCAIQQLYSWLLHEHIYQTISKIYYPTYFVDMFWYFPDHLHELKKPCWCSHQQWNQSYEDVLLRATLV